jgi:ParB-like chromosome segregation protein Spo0J
MAGLRTITSRVIEKEMDPADIPIQQLIENCHEDLNPMERARGIFAAMQAKQMTARQIATELGESETSISNALALVKLPMSVQDLVENGEIAASAASGLAGVEDAELQSELTRQLVERKLTRDGVRGAIRAARKANGKKNEKSAASRVTAMLGLGRSVTVSGEGLDLETFIETLEELIAKARKARPRGIGLSTFIKVLRDEAKA